MIRGSSNGRTTDSDSVNPGSSPGPRTGENAGDFLEVVNSNFEDNENNIAYEDIYSYIRSGIPSIRELLPDYDYLFDVSSGEMRKYAENYPTNIFLENINKEENLEKLNKVNFLNITGNVLNEQATISKIRVVDSVKPDRWEHGMPENFYDEDTDQGLERKEGDETVPKFSSQEINADASIEIDSLHLDLPTKAQCKILHELANIEENNCYYVDTWDIPSILLINVFSPNVSLLENIKVEVVMDEVVVNHDEMDLSLLHLGEHALKITATDEAGNEGEEEVVFKTVASLQSIKDNIIHYEELGFIKGKNTKRKLLSIFREVEVIIKVLDRLEGRTNISDKVKERIALIVKRNINRKVDKLIRGIGRYEKKEYIGHLVRELLVESLDFVKF